MTLRLFAILAALALVVPAAATAKPVHRNEHRAFPHAAQLCHKVAEGHVPKKLQGSEAQLTAACAALKSAFDDAVAAAKPVVAAQRQAIKDARAAAKASCQSGDKAACHAARQDARAKVKAAKVAVRDAVKTYRTAVKTARKAFWTTVKGLRAAGTQPAAPTR